MEISIIEERPIEFRDSIVIEGLPDVGLVGTIATSYLVEHLNVSKLGHIESSLFPPIMVVHKQKLENPVRLYGYGNMIFILSEIAIPTEAVQPLTKALAEWFEQKGVKMLISLSGLPVQDRMEIDKPLVFGIGNSEDAMEELKKNKIDTLEEGFIAGIYALMLNECSKKGIPAVSLLTQCFPMYPDPGAAAEALTSLKKLLNLEIDVKPLLEDENEIKVKARDLMMDTKASMTKMQKIREQEMPFMYG